LLAACGLGVVVLVSVIAASHGTARNSPRLAPNPLVGMRLYVDPHSHAASQIAAWQASGDSADAKLLARIASQPTADWLVGGEPDPAQQAAALVQHAATGGAVPQLVLYNVPGRDCGSYSAGGAPNGAAYLAWVRGVAAGVRGHAAIIVLEPDAVDQAASGCSPRRDASARYALLARAIGILKGNPSSHVYLDAGNAAWLPPGQIARPLKRAGVADADGFALNVSNFQTTRASVAYGRRLSALLGGKHFIVDTSRNGNGPSAGASGTATWCNPPGRALGTPPTTSTGTPLLDALLWIKYPGASDGSCRPGDPPAGAWWPQYALSLARGR
jgi:endoglucanase